MANVFLVYEESFGYRDYWAYYYSFSEAMKFVEMTFWTQLNVEEVPYSTFMTMKGYINFRMMGGNDSEESYN